MRSLLVSTLLLFGFQLGASQLAANEIAGSRIAVAEFWQGGAIADAQGQFDYCEVSISYGPDEVLWLILRRDDVFMFLITTKAFRFTPGEIAPTTVSTDGVSALGVEAQTLDPQTVAMLAQGVDRTIAFVRKGQALSFDFGSNRTMTVATPGVDQALDAAKACLETYSAPEALPGAELPPP